MTFSGLWETGSTNTAVEIYTPGSDGVLSPRGMEGADLSQHAAAAERQSLLLRLATRIKALRSRYEDVVGRHCDY